MRMRPLLAAAGLAACASPAAAQHLPQQLGAAGQAYVDRMTAPLSGGHSYLRELRPPPKTLVVAIKFANVMTPIPDTTAVGAKLADVVVFNNNGSPFGGTLGFGPPYYNAGGCFGIAGSAVVLACRLTAAADGHTLTGTIVAHDPAAP
jgi:hypothetical protein